MERKARNRLTSLHRIDAFLKTHANKLATVNGCGAHKILREHIGTLTRYAAAQRTAILTSRRATRRKAAARAALEREHMRPITRIAAMLLSARHPLVNVGKFPASLGIDDVRDAAQKMARAAQPHAAAIAAAGRPQDFIKRLVAASAALQAAANEQQRWMMASTQATASLATEGRRTRKIVRVLDALVRERIKTPALLREWDAARGTGAERHKRIRPASARNARQRTAAPLPIVEQDLTA